MLFQNQKKEKKKKKKEKNLIYIEPLSTLTLINVLETFYRKSQNLLYMLLWNVLTSS